MQVPKLINISKEEYQNIYWPILQQQISLILEQPKNVQFSHEELFRNVYNLCCQKHAPQLYEDIISLITRFMKQVLITVLNNLNQNFIHIMGCYFQNFELSTHCLCIILRYLDKTYVNTKFKKELNSIFYDMFGSIIINVPEVKLFIEQSLQNIPPNFDPCSLMYFVKGLYTLNKSYAQLNPQLFSLYIPCLKSSQGIEKDIQETLQQLSQLQNEAQNSGNESISARSSTKRKLLISETT